MKSFFRSVDWFTVVILALVVAAVISLTVFLHWENQRRVDADASHTLPTLSGEILEVVPTSFFMNAHTVIRRPDGTVVRAAGTYGVRGDKVTIKNVYVYDLP